MRSRQFARHRGRSINIKLHIEILHLGRKARGARKAAALANWRHGVNVCVCLCVYTCTTANLFIPPCAHVLLNLWRVYDPKRRSVTRQLSPTFPLALAFSQLQLLFCSPVSRSYSSGAVAFAVPLLRPRLLRCCSAYYPLSFRAIYTEANSSPCLFRRDAPK